MQIMDHQTNHHEYLKEWWWCLVLYKGRETEPQYNNTNNLFAQKNKILFLF